MAYDFWEIVYLGREDSKAFLKLLEDLTEQELVDFYWQHREYAEELKEAGIGDHMRPPVTDDSLSITAEWIVDQGIDLFDKIIRDPSKVPLEPPSSDQRRGLDGCASGIYKKRFGSIIRYPDEPPPAVTKENGK